MLKMSNGFPLYLAKLEVFLKSETDCLGPTIILLSVAFYKFLSFLLLLTYT